MRGLCVALALVVAAAACGGSVSTTSTSAASTTIAGTATTTATAADVTSADGRLHLHAEGEGAGDVAIEELDPALFDFGDDIEVMGAYDLGPSGSEFSTPVAMSFDTGDPYDADHPLPLATVLISDEDGTWEALSPVSIDVVDGTVVVSADVPHFSRLVINRGDVGMYIEPDYVDTVVGAEWGMDFDLYDRQFVPITNNPARLGRVFEDGVDTLAAEGTPQFGFVKTLVDSVDYDAHAVATGVVYGIRGDQFIDTYDYLPQSDNGFGLREPSPFVEVFYGHHDFGCDAAGEGTFGVEFDVLIERSDVVFGARFADGQLGLVKPSGGVVLRYAIASPARCRLGYGKFTGLISLYYGANPQLIKLITDKAVEDGTSDPIFSISRQPAGIYVPKADLWNVASIRLRVSQLRNDYLVNYSMFECGDTLRVPDLGGDVTTVCPPGVGEIPEGDVILIAAQYRDLLPSEGDERHYTYAAVFESNGDPTDDWEYQGPYDWDFFIGTDRWYQIDWDPTGGQWSMAVSNGLHPAGDTGARALVMGDTVIWMIPASEFASDAPLYRVTSFVHDGTYQPEVSAGDVSGADPTEPLLPVVTAVG